MAKHSRLRPLPSFLINQREPDPRTCVQCGREGTRGYILDREGDGRYASDAYVCSSENACAERQRRAKGRTS